MKPSKMFKVYTSDLLIADVIESSDNPQVAKLVKKYGLKAGGKITLANKEQFQEFANAFDLEHKEKIPGGSSANTMVTMGRMLKGAVSTFFLGLIGDTDADEKIKADLKSANIKLVPPQDTISLEPPPESALSFVIKFSDGERSIATWPGNAREKLRADMIDSDQFKKCDAIFLQLGLKQKLQETKPVKDGFAPEDELGIADRMLRLRRKNHQELWLAMPTQANFSTSERSHEEKVELFRKLIDNANVVLGNGEELARVFTNKSDVVALDQILDAHGMLSYHRQDKALYKTIVEGLLSEGELLKHEKSYDFVNKTVSIEEGLKRLQQEFEKDYLQQEARGSHPDGKWSHDEEAWQGNTRQVAFITLGKKGVALVTRNHIEIIPALEISERNGNTLGCGDNLYAGVLASYVQQNLHYPNNDMNKEELLAAYKQAARTGVALAAAKLKETDGPRLHDPLESLAGMDQELAKKLHNGHVVNLQFGGVEVGGGNHQPAVHR